MIKETHIKGGQVFALLCITSVNSRLLVDINIIYKCILICTYFYFCYLGSLFPDIDLKNSYISKRYSFLYKNIGRNFKHRGFTHSLLSLLSLSYFFNFLLLYTNNNIVFTYLSSGFFVGYLSHLFLDLLTKEGIEIFYPISINFSILPIKTNSKLEKSINKFLSFITIFLLGYKFYILI